MSREAPGRALRAEWTKLRTLPGTGALLLAVVVLTVAASALAVVTASCSPRDCGHDLPRLTLTGVQVGQALVAVLAVLTICGEYGTGMIRTTFAAMPCRVTVLAAKAVLLTGLTMAAGTVAVLGSLLAGRLILPGNGFPPLPLTDGPTLRAAAGSVLYLALIALFSLGVATLVRDAAPAAGVVFGLLYVLAVLPLMVGDPDWQRFLWRLSPMDAGLAIQATTGLSGLPLGPWEGLGVLAAWAAAALLAAGLLLRARDA